MAEARGVKRLEFGPTDNSGTSLTLMIKDFSDRDEVFVLGSEKLPTMIGMLLRIASHPGVNRHFPESTQLNVGSTAELIPLPYENIAAGYAETTGTVGLMVQLPGDIQFGFVLPVETAQRLSEDLGQAGREAKIHGNKPSLN